MQTNAALDLGVFQLPLPEGWRWFESGGNRVFTSFTLDRQETGKVHSFAVTKRGSDHFNYCFEFSDIDGLREQVAAFDPIKEHEKWLTTQISA